MIDRLVSKAASPKIYTDHHSSHVWQCLFVLCCASLHGPFTSSHSSPALPRSNKYRSDPIELFCLDVPSVVFSPPSIGPVLHESRGPDASTSDVTYYPKLHYQIQMFPWCMRSCICVKIRLQTAYIHTSPMPFSTSYATSQLNFVDELEGTKPYLGPCIL